MRVLACPGCGVKIKIPEGKSGRCTCPKCGKALMIKAPGDAANTTAGQTAPVGNQPRQHTPTPQPDSLQLPSAQPLPNSFPQLPAAGSYAALGRPATRGATKRPAATGSWTPLKDFLKPLGIGHGILAAVLLLIGALGLISEPIALTACLIGVGAILGMVIGGRVWIIVIAFQESVTQGLLVLFVPYYWLIYPSLRKGRALRPMALVFSSLIPALICLGMLAVFMPKYQGGMRIPGARSRGPSAADLAKLQTQIRESHNTSPDADVLRSVSFPTYSQVRGVVDLAQAEQVLNELPGYVPGTFRFHAEERTASFQYRGAEEMAPRYGLYLAAKAKISMTFTPTFNDGAFLQKESSVAVNRPAGTAFKASPTSSAPAIDISAAIAKESNKLHTVSFQTLAQSAVDPAAAEQALTQVNGYVAGSFRFDERQQLVTLQYNGTEAAATQFGSALALKLQMMVRLKPMFAEE